MGKRRMFLAELIKSDRFYSLPSPAQTLYIHLNLDADDDGFVGNPKAIARSLNIKYTYLDTLIDRGYLIEFESGVVAVTHWNLHNKIRRDRYTATRFYEEYSRLEIKGGIYFKSEESQAGQGFPDFFDNQTATQGNVNEENVSQSSPSEFIYPQGSRRKDSEQFSTQIGGKLYEELTEDKYEEADKAKYLTYRKSLSSDNLLIYLEILKDIKSYFEKVSNETEYRRFVTYNEERSWQGRDGEDILGCFEKYAAAWLDKKKEFF